jgi:hypothetical protein
MAEGYAFMPEALETNAAGRLTDDQKAMFKQGSALMRFLPTMMGDLRKGEVKSIEGPLRKTTPLDIGRPAGTQRPRAHALEVAGRSFDVPSKTVWDAVPEAGYFRLYYLPRTKTAVNLERLPDPPVEATREDVLGAVGGALSAALRPSLTKDDLVQKAETAAHADAVLRAAGIADVSGAATAPDGEAASSDEVVGRWTSVFFDVDVRSDGTLTLQNPQLPAQPGRWHIDDEGQLHVLFDGEDVADELVTPVTLSGDRLSLDFGGQQITLQRPA